MAEFQEVISEYIRMCDYYAHCTECPLNALSYCGNMRNADKLAVEGEIMAWAAKHPEPVYPNWSQWLIRIGVMPKEIGNSQYRAIIELGLIKPIPADIAQKLGLEPKEE